VFLLKSAKNASFINRVVPGANIPPSIIERLAAAADPASEGIAIAAEQVASYRTIAQGVHLMAIKAEERIPEILRLAGLAPLDAGGDGVVVEDSADGVLLTVKAAWRNATSTV